MSMTMDEVEQRIVKALVDLFHERLPKSEGEGDPDVVARTSNVPVGHVRRFVRDFGMSLADGTEICWNKDQLDELEAHVLLPIVEPAVVASQQFNVNAGSGSQVQVGHSVSGHQSMVTYQQILEQLRGEIERSAMPEEEKKTALQRLGEFMKSPALVSILNLGATIARLGTGG